MRSFLAVPRTLKRTPTVCESRQLGDFNSSLTRFTKLQFLSLTLHPWLVSYLTCSHRRKRLDSFSLSMDLQDFLLRARVLRLYRQALRISGRAPSSARGNQGMSPDVLGFETVGYGQ
ncbi:uncharacterized protein LOC108337725 isoform X2 [Vigna angularis]|uniref:uncharacterized protein LOC108337725 isoform X2 n=1 Tax=Phaseolus angularis TaxID=3914 RepID=UPI0022B2D816|nr:uncharacterized protein LOC108337725 isoform X2 [Vigna angularis]